MDDLIPFLLGFLCVMIFITLIGHASWLVLSSVFRVLFGSNDRPKRDPVRPRLQEPDELPWVREQRELEITRRNLEELAARGDVSRDLLAPILLKIAARQATMGGQATPAAALSSADRMNELRQLLTGSLAGISRPRVLELSQTAQLGELAQLPAALQFNLAKILEQDDQIWRALKVYRALITAHGDHPGCIPTALEAGKLAARRSLIDEASYFLGEVLRRDAPESATATAQELLAQLRPARAPAAPAAGRVMPTEAVEPAPTVELSRPAVFEAEVIEPSAPAPIEPVHVAPLEPPPHEPLAPEVPSLVAVMGSRDQEESPEYGQRPPEATGAIVAPTPIDAPALGPLAARPVESPSPVAPTPRLSPAPPKPPGKPFAEVLSAFMEERNIRWGELIGGLLMVGCSIALVLSLWNTLAKIPYYQFVVFSLSTAAVYGVGLYTQHRWKLASTSHGVLIIASLLVPLNFLAMALSASRSAFIRIPLELAALGAFAWLGSQAARTITPGGRWQLPVGVLGSSASMLAIARLLPADATPGLLEVVGLGLLPLVAHVTAIGGMLRAMLTAGEDAPRRPQAEAMFALLGTTVFALLIALGLLVTRAGDLAADWLAVHGSLAAIPVAAVGLLLMDRLKDDATLAGYRTAATGIAIAGMVAMAGATAAAWPWPWEMILVGLVNYGALSAMAWRSRMPAAHLLALAVLAGAYLTGFHTLWGAILLAGPIEWSQIARADVLAKSGSSLTAFFLAVTLAGDWLSRRGRAEDARWYEIFAGIVAVLSLGLVTLAGYHTADQAVRSMIVYALYGVGALAANSRLLRPGVSYAGFALLVGSSLWGLWWHQQQVTGLWSELLAGEALLLAVVSVGIFEWLRAEPSEGEGEAAAEESAFSLPAGWCAAIAGVLAAGLGIWQGLETHGTIIEPAWAGMLLAATSLLLAWRFESEGPVRLAALWFLASAGYALSGPWAGWAAYPWSIAALVSATAMGVPAVVLAWLAPREGEPRDSTGEMLARLNRVFAQPLGESALAASVVSFPAIAVFSSYSATQLAIVFGWLAALWLAGAILRRSAELFTAFQVAQTAAVIAGTQAWIEVQPWYAQAGRVALSTPEAAHAFVLSLGVLALIGALLRLALAKAQVAQDMMNPAWPAFDRVLARGLALGVLAMNGAWVMTAAAFEYEPGYAAALAARFDVICGPMGWSLLGLLALTQIAALFNGWRPADGLAYVAMVVSAGYLLAGSFHGDLAVASALRWSLAADFLLAGAVLWGRTPMRALAERCGASLDRASPRPRAAEILALLTLAAPVCIFTGVSMLAMMTGGRPPGPLASSVFAGMNPLVNYPIPVLILVGAMVGFAVRETSSTYAFAGGLLFSLASVAGYVMQGELSNWTFGVYELVVALQIGTLATALWALGWLAMRSWLGVWNETGESRNARRLMNWQLGQGALGNAFLLITGCALLALFHPWGVDWPAAVGSGWGWGALAASTAAWWIRSQQAGTRLAPNRVGLLGLGTLGLVACSVQALAPEWGARTLMLNWAFYALAVVLATWFVATRAAGISAEAVQELMSMAARWVRVSGFLAVLVAMRLALWHDEQLYAAAGITVASLAGAMMAVWRRREGWAFVAGWGANVAATLVVWHFLLARKIDVDSWWLHFLEANTIAAGTVAVLWLLARRRLYAREALSVEAGPLLGLQVGLTAIGCAVFVSMAGFDLIVEAGSPPSWLGRIGDASSVIAVLLTGLAGVAYVRQIARERVIDVVAPVLLAFGVLAACQVVGHEWALRAADETTPIDTWSSYHMLLASWSIAGIVLLVVGVALAERQPDWVSSVSVHAWVTLISIALGVLAIRGAEDSAGPGWPASQAALGAVLAASLAVWLRLPLQVWLSAALVNVAASVVWWGFEGQTPVGRPMIERLALANVLGLASSSLAWTALGMLWRRAAEVIRSENLVGADATTASEDAAAFPHGAAAIAVAVLAVLVLAGLASDLGWVTFAPPLALGGWLGWGALGACLASILLLAVGRSAAYTSATLYFGGLTALALALHQAHLAPRDLGWWGALGLAGYVLAASAVARVTSQSGWWKPREIGGGWFFGVQAVQSIAVFALASWISLDRDFARTDGLAGPLAAALALGATFLMVFGDWAHENSLRLLRAMTLTGTVVVVAAAGWAVWPWLEQVGGTTDAYVLQSLAVLLPAASLSLAVGAFGMNVWLPADSPWKRSNGRVTIGWGIVSILALVAALWLEWNLLEARVTVPWATTIGLALGILGLAGIAIAWALAESSGLDLIQRQNLVYAAEAMLFLLGLHVRMTRPELFGGGFFQRYGVFLLMLLAFVGAGLSELFRRRNVEVLSQPLYRTALFLPLLSGMMFWFLTDPSPLVWFLISGFYGFLSVQRGSTVLGMLAAVSFNVGLWVIWHEQNLHFADHLQLWLIPLGLSALAAEQLNHRRLSKEQAASIRYLAMSLIYVSSTADMFLAGVDREHWYLPLVLAGLSVLGVLAGIALRIRPFLFLGASFLLLSIATIIWHAAANQTWIWYVVGILTGAGIIAMFALFEKRRNDILLALEKFKGWE